MAPSTKPALVICLLFPWLLSAQKIEVEKRVAPSLVPMLMQQFLEKEYPGLRKLKYYEERNESGRYFEAKFCFERLRYSVKFTPEGELVDTESQIPYNTLPEEVARLVEQQLSAQFQRYKVTKTQEVLKNGRVSGYELEISGKRERELGLFEGQFDASGTLQSLRTIEQPPNNFIFF